MQPRWLFIVIHTYLMAPNIQIFQPGRSNLQRFEQAGYRLKIIISDGLGKRTRIILSKTLPRY